MNDRFIPYGRQDLGEAEKAAVLEVLGTDFITQGPRIAAFEAKLAERVGAQYATACATGTAALHLAMMSLDVQPGDEVIVPSITFVATANCFVYLGATPVFCDIKLTDYNIDEDAIEGLITEKTKGVISVDLAGQSCDHEKIQAICQKHGLWHVEDACHALGSKYRQTRTGGCAHADMTVFSFHPVKTITTGEGGAVLTNDAELDRALKKFRNHGIVKEPEFLEQHGPWYYEMQSLGFNYRITDLQAVLGSTQLDRLDDFIGARRKQVETYNAAFSGIEGLTRPFEFDYNESSFHLYVLRIEFEKFGTSRKTFMMNLFEKRIGTQVHYIPVHSQPFYRELLDHTPELPNTETYYRTAISIPLFPKMTEAEQARVIEAVKAELGIG